MASFALSLGARVESCDIAGDAALALAARSGHTAVVELLIDNGADVDAVNKVSKRYIYVIFFVFCIMYMYVYVFDYRLFNLFFISIDCQVLKLIKIK